MKKNQQKAARQAGLTLIELLVALVISSVIAIAAISALVVSRQGFSTVDAASQLRDNARFATDMLQRFGVQAGFNDFTDATTVWPKNSSGKPVGDPVSNVRGFNNAKASGSDPLNTATARTSTSELGYGSDVLILRYQEAETYPGSNNIDKSMIDCFGNSPAVAVTAPGDRRANIIHVGVDDTGEPSLRCSTDVTFTSQALVRGVENFQVLYGVDGVTAGAEATGTKSNLATNYLRADQLTVTGDTDGSKTNANWRRVRSLKIGMVIRGPLGSAQQAISQTYYPLGNAISVAGGTAGSAMSSSDDKGTAYTPAADTRLRQVVTFTIHLRNEQGI